MSEEGYRFIEEEITKKKPNKVYKYIKKMFFIIFAAAVFGIVAAVFFNMMDDILHKNEIKSQFYLKEPVKTPGPTEIPTMSSQNDAENNNTDVYSDKYKNIARFCKNYEDMLVTVSERIDGYDYFSNPVTDSTSRSGLIVKKDSERVYVLTVGQLDMTKEYRIILRDDMQLRAVQENADVSTGLMILSADISGLNKDVKNGLKEAILNRKGSVNRGDIVYAIGNPRGEMYSIAYGYVCSEAIDNYMVDRYMTAYKTNMYMSENGLGFVLDSEGVVIGIASDRLGQTNNDISAFVGVAEIRNDIERLINDTERVMTGVIAYDINAEYLAIHGLENGIYVADISVASPALYSDIAIGDVIISVNDMKVNTVKEYVDIISGYNAGDNIEIMRYRERARNNKYKTVRVTLGKDE